MMYMQHEVNRILVNAESPGMTLRNLYELYKKHMQKFSLSFICKRSGIPSKGYLAFVMTGERKLNEKYWSPVFDVFKLNADQCEILLLLFQRDVNPGESWLFNERIKAQKNRLN